MITPLAPPVRADFRKQISHLAPEELCSRKLPTVLSMEGSGNFFGPHEESQLPCHRCDTCCISISNALRTHEITTWTCKRHGLKQFLRDQSCRVAIVEWLLTTGNCRFSKPWILRSCPGEERAGTSRSSTLQKIVCTRGSDGELHGNWRWRQVCYLTLCVDSMAERRNTMQHIQQHIQPAMQHILIFAHKVFHNKQSVQQILHQPTVYIHWYYVCRTRFDLVVIGHICPSRHETLSCAELCWAVLNLLVQRKLFGPTDPGLFDQRFVGAATWWGDELLICLSCLFGFWSSNTHIMDIIEHTAISRFSLRHLVRVSHGWIQGVGEKITARGGKMAMWMWSKIGELHEQPTQTLRPAANGCNTGSRRLLTTAPRPREFKGSENLWQFASSE